ncbi:MAG: hypothetical protein ACOX6V_05475 [Patescibacteria group bacterium]|jgi:hypothetical protein
MKELQESFEIFWHLLFGGEYDKTNPQGKVWDWIKKAIRAYLNRKAEEFIKKYRTLSIQQATAIWDFIKFLEGDEKTND